MASQVAVKVTGLPEVQRMLKRHNIKGNRRILDRALRAAAFKIQANAATKQIIRGGNQPPVPDRLTSRTGTLRRSIRTDFSELPRAVEIGTALVYGRVHELGIPPMPKRAFLEPAAREEGEKFADLLYSEWKKETYS